MQLCQQSIVYNKPHTPQIPIDCSVASVQLNIFLFQPVYHHVIDYHMSLGFYCGTLFLSFSTSSIIHPCRWARCGHIGYCLCVFVRLRISPPRIKLAVSNFAWRFINVQGRESPILLTLLPQNPKSDETASACDTPTCM